MARNLIILLFIMSISIEAFANGGNCNVVFNDSYQKISLREFRDNRGPNITTQTINAFPIARVRSGANQVLFYGENGWFYIVDAKKESGDIFTNTGFVEPNYTLPRIRCRGRLSCHGYSSLFAATQAHYGKTGQDLKIPDEAYQKFVKGEDFEPRRAYTYELQYMDLLEQIYELAWPKGYRDDAKPEIGLWRVRSMVNSFKKQMHALDKKITLDQLLEVVENKAAEIDIRKTPEFDVLYDHIQEGKTATIEGLIIYRHRRNSGAPEEKPNFKWYSPRQYLQKAKVVGYLPDRKTIISYKSEPDLVIKHPEIAFANPSRRFLDGYRNRRKQSQGFQFIQNTILQGEIPSPEMAHEFSLYFNREFRTSVAVMKVFEAGPLEGNFLVFDPGMGKYSLMKVDHVRKQAYHLTFTLFEANNLR